MAVTKTHPIKSTLKAAIDYILNPEKTDGKLLASSFGCGLETADIEFAWTREAAGDRGTHLGRHLIQSFAVGETTPEEAHKIGMELAGAVLGGKYEFVLTTHVDIRKYQLFVVDLLHISRPLSIFFTLSRAALSCFALSFAAARALRIEGFFSRFSFFAENS